jgi:hypothetical protein
MFVVHEWRQIQLTPLSFHYIAHIMHIMTTDMNMMAYGNAVGAFVEVLIRQSKYFGIRFQSV